MIQKLFDQIDSMPDKKLLHINAYISFIIVSLYLVLWFFPDLNEDTGLSIPYFLLAVIIFLTCMYGFAEEKHVNKILKFQTPVFLLVTIFLISYMVDLKINGLPQERFSWAVGIFSFICVYPLYLVRRLFLLNYFPKIQFLNYGLIVLLLIAIVFDISVMIQA